MTKIIKNRFVQGALRGVRPVILALILSTAIIFFIKMMLFSGNDIFSQTVAFDRKSTTLLLLLAGYVIMYKKINKKGLNPIALLGISAGLGIILFV